MGRPAKDSRDTMVELKDLAAVDAEISICEKALSILRERRRRLLARSHAISPSLLSLPTPGAGDMPLGANELDGLTKRELALLVRAGVRTIGQVEFICKLANPYSVRGIGRRTIGVISLVRERIRSRPPR